MRERLLRRRRRRHGQPNPVPAWHWRVQVGLLNLQAALRGSLASCCPPSEALAARPSQRDCWPSTRLLAPLLHSMEAPPSQPTGSAADAAPAAAAPTQVRSCVRRLSATLLVNRGLHVFIQAVVCGCLFATQAGAGGSGAAAAPAYRRTPSIEAALAAELPEHLHGVLETPMKGKGRSFNTQVGLWLGHALTACVGVGVSRCGSCWPRRGLHVQPIYFRNRTTSLAPPPPANRRSV